MRNRQLVVTGVFLSDVEKALHALGVPLTKENIKAATAHVEGIASAWARATLQDTTYAEWAEWIKTYDAIK